MLPMSFAVEYTDEFERWWGGLSEREQDSVAASVSLLKQRGPHLPFPHSSNVRGSRYSHLRELRVQHEGRPYRVLYAFDPRRVAILLIGVTKAATGAGTSGSSQSRKRSTTSTSTKSRQNSRVSNHQRGSTSWPGSSEI
jgi:hypothetical protein